MRRGIILAVVAATFWSTTSVIVDRLLTFYRVTPVDISFWRLLAAAAALAAFIAATRPDAFRISRRELPWYAALGLVGVAGLNVLWSASVQVNKAAVGAVLVFSAPVFVAIAGRILFREALTAIQGGAIVANLCGCALVAGAYDPAVLARNPAGLAIGLASSLPFAAYSILSKGVALQDRRGTLTVLFYSFLFAAAGLLAWGLLAEGAALLAPRLDLAGWLLLIGLALGPTLIGYGLFTASLAYLPSAQATLVTTLEPPLAAILALLFMNRTMNGIQWLGTSLIVAGMIAMQWGATAAVRKPGAA